MSSGPAVWLFKKRLNLRDVNVGLGELVLEDCSEVMKEVLARLATERTSRRYVRVLVDDPRGESYQLRLINYLGGIHVLADDWGLIVAANELEVGDTVVGWGNVAGDGSGGEIYFTCELAIHRQNQEDPNSSSGGRESPSSGNRFPEHKRGDDGDEKKTPAEVDDAGYSPIRGGNEKNMSSSQETAADPPIWLFKKRLSRRDVDVGVGELVLEECCEAMKEALAGLPRERSCRYVKVLTQDRNGAFYELQLMDFSGGLHVLGHDWDLIVTANGLKMGDTVEARGNVFDNDGDEIYFICELDIRRQNPEGSSSSSGERDLPSSGNQDPQHKRGDHGNKRKTPANGDDVKNTKEKENPAEGYSKRMYSPSSEKFKSVGGNEEIDAGVIPSERNRLISSPAIQESEQVDVEDSADGENPEMKEGLTNPREIKKAVSPFEKELDYADIELVIKQCTGTLKVLLYFLRKLVKNDYEKNLDEEMKVAMDEVMKKIVEIKGRMEERV